MKLQPLHDRIVVRRSTAKEVTKGGIVLPDNAKEKPLEGEVLAVGPGRFLEGLGIVAPTLCVGDRVLFDRFAGVEVKLDGEEYVVVREGDVLGKIAKE